MTYHTFAKPVAFFSAGTLAQLHRSSDFDAIGGGTLSRTPVASGLLLLATLMVTGSPPFGLFWSEMTILKAGFFGPHLAVVAVFLAALVVLFCGFFYQVGEADAGAGHEGARPHRSCRSGSTWPWARPSSPRSWPWSRRSTCRARSSPSSARRSGSWRAHEPR